MLTRKTGGMFLRTTQNGVSVCSVPRLALDERVSSRSCAVVRRMRNVFPSVTSCELYLGHCVVGHPVRHT